MAVDVGSAIAYLDLDITGFNSALSAAGNAIEVFSTNTASTVEKTEAIGKAIEKTGTALTRSITLPLTALGGYSTKAFVDFESAFAGVTKTVDATSEQYEVLSDEIKKMATETASSSSEIAGVMEVVGQLGIGVENGTEEIVKFTKAMIMLGDSTNLSAEEAASSLAQFSNIMGTSKGDVDRLGSSIVDLGNKFATTESDIVYMSHRLASAGKIAGLTEQEVLALSTAMSSVGIHAEAGGTAMSQTLKALESAVSNYTGKAEDALNGIAYVAQVSADDFKNAWQSSPIEAIRMFISGLGSLEERGENAILMLDELGMSGIRQSNMLKALALSSEELARAIDVSNAAWDENRALSDEASKRYETTESKLKQLKESFNNVAIEIGEILLPYLQKLVDWLQKLVDWWNGLSESQKNVIVTIGLVIAAIGPLVKILGDILGLVSKIKAIGGLLGIFKGAEVVSSATAATTALGGLSSSVATVTGTTSVLTAVLGKAGTAFKSFGGVAITTGTALATFDVIKNPVIKAIGAITGETEKSEKMLQRYGYAGDTLRIIGDNVDLLKKKFSGLPVVLDGAQFSSQALGEAFEMINKGVVFTDEQLGKIHEKWQMSEEDMESIRQAMIDANPEIVEITNNFTALNDASFETMQQVANGLTEMANNGKTVDDILSGNVKSVGDLSQQSMSFFSSIKNGVVEVQTSLGVVQKKLVESSGMLNETGRNIVKGLGVGVKSETPKAITEISNTISAVLKPVKSLSSNTGVDSGKNLVAGFNKGVSERSRETVSLVGMWMDSTKNTIHKSLDEHSPSGESEKSGKNLVLGFNKGVGDNSDSSGDYVTSWLNDLVGMLGKLALNNSIYSIGYQVMATFLNGMKSGWNEVVTWLGQQTLALNSVSVGYNRLSGSHATGLDYVPFNGYVAQLHKGERVLTKSEAKEYSQQNSNNKGDTFIFNSPKAIDEYEATRLLKQTIREINL